MTASRATKGLKLGAFSKFVTSNEFIAVASAVILSPIFIKYLRPYIMRAPLIKAHPALSFLAISLILFLAAGIMGGTLKVILIGAAAGALLTALLTTTAVSRALSYLPSGANA